MGNRRLLVSSGPKPSSYPIFYFFGLPSYVCLKHSHRIKLICQADRADLKFPRRPWSHELQMIMVQCTTKLSTLCKISQWSPRWIVLQNAIIVIPYLQNTYTRLITVSPTWGKKQSVTEISIGIDFAVPSFTFQSEFQTLHKKMNEWLLPTVGDMDVNYKFLYNVLLFKYIFTAILWL